MVGNAQVKRNQLSRQLRVYSALCASSTAQTLASPMPWPGSRLVERGSCPSGISTFCLTRLRTEITSSPSVFFIRTCTSGGAACAAASMALLSRLDTTMTRCVRSSGMSFRSERSKYIMTPFRAASSYFLLSRASSRGLWVLRMALFIWMVLLMEVR